MKRGRFSLTRVNAVVRKEIRHILRDWQTLLIIIAMPVVMMFLYGYALTLDVQEVPVLVEDRDNTPESRELIGRIHGSPLFSVSGVVSFAPDVTDLIIRHDVKAIFRIPARFASDLRGGGRPAVVQTVIDGSDPNVGTILRNASEPLLRGAVLDILNIDEPKMISLKPRVLYNEEQKSSLFFVPGLMALLLVLISTLLTSLTLTREKERGTLEQLLVSPLHPLEIIAGKIVPYLFLSALDGIIILVVGALAFSVRVSGSLLLLAFSSVIYIVTALSLGILFSTVAKNQQQAMFLALPVTLMPTVVLSGFIFPLSSMPLFLQGVSCAIPATYYLQIIRGIILKGVGVSVLWPQILVLCAMGLFLLAISAGKFRVKL